VRWALLLALVTACGSEVEEPEVCATSDDPTFLLGTDHGAKTPFVALEDDQPLQLIRGPQNGCHLPLAFLTHGFDASMARVHYRLTLLESDTVMNEMMATVNLDPVPAGPTTCGAADFRAFMIEAWRAEEKRVRIDVAITDLRGARASETVVVLVQWPDAHAEVEHDQLCGSRS
jgi:hypothetical protein